MNAHFTLSQSKVLEQYEKAKALADAVSYSAKTNQEVTKILEVKTDSLFSVHIDNELKHIKDMSRVLFFAQGWSKDDIQTLLDKGIDYLVVDNETDLDTLLQFLEGKDVRIKLLLRMKLRERSIRTERYYVFGMRSEVVNKRIRELKDHPNLSLLGVHFHRKTQNLSEWNLRFELEQILEPDVLERMDVLNIGGGLPSVYANTNENVIGVVMKKVQELRTWLNSLNIKMIIEPGRFIAAEAGQLVTKIIAIHDDTVIVNASVYNSDLDAIIVPVKLLIEGEGTGKPYKVKGKTPCSMDLFRYKVLLENPKVGDTLVFLNAGAYNFTTDFCDLEKLETEIIE